MEYRSTIDLRYSSEVSNHERDVPSFIEPRPPLILNPFMRPRPQKGTNLLELFEEDDSVGDEAPELVQVYLRLKPSNVPSSLYEVRSDKDLITSVDTATAGHGRRTQHNVSKMYTFSHIFGPDTNQKEIFEHVVKDNLRRLPDGHNFTLLTYGASGSGKTYTLMGTVRAPGLVPRSLEYVFKVVDAAQTPLYRPGDSKATKLSNLEQEHELQWVRHLRHVSAPLRHKYRRMSMQLSRQMTKSTIDLSNRTKHYVWVSFVEIYNEAIYDLLVTTDRTAASKLRIREDPTGNVYVKGATQAFVRTGEEAYDVLVAGKHNLQVHATGVHAHSSRSHCIFTITMLTETEGGVRSSYVRLCDLAGSERARRTRNTGARMAESRAINSSLHVLERCLHTLRRRQAHAHDLVPYRESKLTRLLGAGLSGTRGEAVSMVVTLNPAPEYAHETRHVLQLAAVARDIQVNNTIAESISTLESSCSQDTTVASNTELVRLRADNERLHYELVQAQALNKKLMADMAEQQEENAVTVKELVDEARDITQQYYQSQLSSLEERHEAEMAELREEYEAKLTKAVVADEGTPSRALQNKVMQLMKQIAILEEELTAERLAKARMKEEMLHLRACIEERDEKASEDSNQEDAIQLTDSEDDSDEADDLCNDSLEPTFKKEVINRSRLMRRSSMLNNTHNNTYDNMNKSQDTAKDDSLTDNMADTTYDDSKRDSTLTQERTDETYDVSNSNSCHDQSVECPTTVKKMDTTKNKATSVNGGDSVCIINSKVDLKQNRETYFVNSNLSLSGDVEKKDAIQNTDAAISADTGISVSLRDDEDLKDFSIIGDICVLKPVKPIETQIDKIKRSAMATVSSDSFELLESEAKDFEKNKKYFNNETENKTVSISPRQKEKKPYFDYTQPSPSQISIVKDVMKKHDLLRSPSIVQDEIPENYKPTTISKIMRESFTISTDVPNTLNKNKVLMKLHDSIDPFEEVESPYLNKQNLLKSVEKVRKSNENVSIVKKEIEMKSETKDVIIEKENVLRSVEKVRKSNENVSIVKKEIEIKSETKDVIIEKEVCNKIMDAELSEEVNCSDGKDLEVQSAPKGNDNIECTLQYPSKIESDDKVNLDIDVKCNMLSQVKQELTNTENVSEHTTDKELETEGLPSEISSLNDVTNVNQTIGQNNNTIDAFENIYKYITAPRATDFELLISDKSLNTTTGNLTNIKIDEALLDKLDNDSEAINENPEEKMDNNKHALKENHDKDNNNHENIQENEVTETKKGATKYKLRQKTHDAKNENDKEILVENTAKCASRTVKKSLRLRKRNKIDEPLVDEDVKLKDIVNLQKEFSDVTLDVPAPEKVFKDMPSPEKSESENLPPLMGVQSCPSKSVTRSRRKLFTPRAEPLEESPPVGDSGERIRVPRPSYHRGTRTRRRLN